MMAAGTPSNVEIPKTAPIISFNRDFLSWVCDAFGGRFFSVAGFNPLLDTATTSVKTVQPQKDRRSGEDQEAVRLQVGTQHVGDQSEWVSTSN
jgi:hypothetical protein